jgi:GcrA cell cycle regulator
VPWGADWTVERKALVRRLWERGYTATQIANRLDIAVTRNAVIGLAHRNRWGHGMRQEDKPRKPSPRKHATRPLPRSAPEPRQPVPAEGLTIFDLLDHHCRWPNGEQPPFQYCGHDKVDGSPYCAAHHRKAYQ